ncbi:MAG: type II toxin-antitoxin system prevent-host-death family antitoxin [Chloroflexi bacterium]|nr:type II toxin-antitoxin system prevent-host-death family antitoxin [Chloroflexota bacterium]
MNETRVGTRELKSRLSEYLRRVKAGQTVVVTERGKVIGQIVPVAPTLEERLRALADAGFLEWNGKKFEPHKPTIINRGPKLVSDLVSEGRDVDYLP